MESRNVKTIKVTETCLQQAYHLCNHHHNIFKEKMILIVAAILSFEKNYLLFIADLIEATTRLIPEDNLPDKHCKHFGAVQVMWWALRVHSTPPQPLTMLNLHIPPLFDRKTTIITTRKTPTKLWRAVHAEYTGNGVWARGFSANNIDNDNNENNEGISLTTANFKACIKNHLNWWCRRPSPFLSAFSKRDKAVELCRKFARLGFSAIKLLEIDVEHLPLSSSSASPCPSVPIGRVRSSCADTDSLVHTWSVDEALASLGVQKKRYHEDEYLFAYAIPEEYVRCVEWEV